MKTIENIRQLQLDARRTRSSDTTGNKDIIVSLTTTLIGEAETIAKNAGVEQISDADLQNLIKKFIKNISQTIEHLEGVQRDKLIFERDYLSQFLPKQMNDEELSSTIDKIVEEGATNMGLVMKALQTNYTGLYDAKAASNLVKQKLS